MDGQLHIQATDLELTFYQRIDAEINPDAPLTSFRIHTGIVKFVGSLPMNSDQMVRFHEDNDTHRIVVQYAKSATKIMVPTIEGEYPVIEWFDYDKMDEAVELASKLEAVSWAIEDSATGVTAGIRIDGEWLEAMCSKQMARIKCSVAATEPVVGVLKTLTPVIKMGSHIRFTTLAGRIIVGLDEFAQVSSSTVLGPWPNLSEKVEQLVLPQSFTINKQRLLDALGRVLAFSSGDRFPRIKMMVLTDRINIDLFDAKDGDITDSCALSTREGDEDTEFIFNPAWLLAAVDSFPGNEVRVSFATPKLPIKLTEPMTSYYALIMGLMPGEKVESPTAGAPSE